MDHYFLLIDLTSGNVIGEYDRAEDALSDIRRVADEHGMEQINDLSLMELSEREESVVAMKGDLVRLATSEQSERRAALRQTA